jgi:large subunit ribosomal protein L13
MLKASKTDMNTKGAVTPKWCLVDADGKVLGRLASRVATILQGKHRAAYVPHMDTGDFVVVINAEKVVMSGKKLDQKVYRHHTGYVGHLVETSAREMMEKKPEEVIRLAVKRMLPQTKLGRQMFGKLKVYRGPEHPHAAQKPEVLDI